VGGQLPRLGVSPLRVSRRCDSGRIGTVACTAPSRSTDRIISCLVLLRCWNTMHAHGDWRVSVCARPHPYTWGTDCAVDWRAIAGLLGGRLNVRQGGGSSSQRGLGEGVGTDTGFPLSLSQRWGRVRGVAGRSIRRPFSPLRWSRPSSGWASWACCPSLVLVEAKRWRRRGKFSTDMIPDLCTPLRLPRNAVGRAVEVYWAGDAHWYLLHSNIYCFT
jgi:hypothetical protein